MEQHLSTNRRESFEVELDNNRNSLPKQLAVPPRSASKDSNYKPSWTPSTAVLPTIPIIQPISSKASRTVRTMRIRVCVLSLAFLLRAKLQCHNRHRPPSEVDPGLGMLQPPDEVCRKGAVEGKSTKKETSLGVHSDLCVPSLNSSTIRKIISSASLYAQVFLINCPA